MKIIPLFALFVTAVSLSAQPAPALSFGLSAGPGTKILMNPQLPPGNGLTWNATLDISRRLWESLSIVSLWTGSFSGEGQTGTLVKYRGTTSLHSTPGLSWTLPLSTLSALEVGLGPDFSVYLFPAEKSYTYALGGRAYVSWTLDMEGRPVALSLPIVLTQRLDGTTDFSFSLTAGVKTLWR